MTARRQKGSAATMRQAAHEIRDDAPLATRSVRPFLIAVADWLGESADNLDAGPDEPGAIESAHRIAVAYLGQEAS